MVLQNFLETRGHLKPVNNIANFNVEPKKKPHNIQINNNARQPKITPNIKYTDKQRFRRYKTKTEPRLFDKIQVNEEDDIISKIRAAFDPNYIKPNTNYEETTTGPALFNERAERAPEPPTKLNSSTTPYNSELLSVMELNKKFEKDMTPEEENERNRLIDKYDLDNVDLEKQPAIGMKIMTQLLQKRNEKMGDIDDISREDYEDLTFQPAKIDLFKTPKTGEGSVYGDTDVSINQPKLKYTKEEAGKLLQHNIAKHIGKKRAKPIRKDYDELKFENSLLGNNEMTISSIKQGNKIIGLQGETSSPERTKRYAAGLDLVLPTPQKLAFSTTKDMGTVKRGRGRPPKSSYSTSTPTSSSFLS